MKAGRVIGKVVPSRTVANLPAGSWLVINPFNREQYRDPWNAPLSGEPSVVAFDELGAGEGEIVGFVEGGEASWHFPAPAPVDTYVSVIFDRINYHD